jgi:Integrase core domain
VIERQPLIAWVVRLTFAFDSTAKPTGCTSHPFLAKVDIGKIERWHKSLKSECIRPGTPLSLDDARRLVQGYVEHYNNIRLNSAIGYITPKDMLAGRQQEIHTQRDRKLAAARCQRQISRRKAAVTSNGQQQLLPKVPILSLNMDI